MEIALTAALVLTVGIAAALDVKGQTIPNWVIVAGLVAALAVRALPGGPLLVPGLTGFGLAFALMLPLFALKLVGGGDAKLLMVVGAMLGPAAFLLAFLYASVVGGVLAIIAAASSGALKTLFARSFAFAVSLVTLGRRGIKLSVSDPSVVTIPYGVAIAAGAIMARFIPLVG